MFRAILVIALICLICGIIGFTGKPQGLRQAARVFFFLFLVIFLAAVGYYLFQTYFHPNVELDLKMPSAPDVPGPFKNN